MNIHILSPSGAIEPHYIDEARIILERNGHHTSVSPHAKGRFGRFSGTLAERTADLNAAFANTDIDVILCSRGGYGMAQIIDSLHLPKKRCPLVIGFSDITCLHNLLGKHNIPSLHAIMTKHIATLPTNAPALQGLLDALQGQPITYNLPAHPLNRKGIVQGTLRGGNLSVLYGLQGTPYTVNTDDDTILFIEDICEQHYHIDRMMQNLRLSGILDCIQGLIVGQFTHCDNDPLMKKSIQETILEAVSPYNYPVAFDFPAGHVENNLPLWLNTPCTLCIDESGTHFVQKASTY